MHQNGAWRFVREFLAWAMNAPRPEMARKASFRLDWLRKRGDNWAQELADNRVRCALNQEMTDLSACISEKDEVAIFSPISGG